VREVGEPVDDGPHLCLAHPPTPCAAWSPGDQVSGLFCFRLGDPRDDRGRARARVEGGTVPGELAVALGDLERGFVVVAQRTGFVSAGRPV
jgi:hypothetical protein